jgi:hypothetical protein
MPNQVLLLHGWSDTSKSFRPLGEFLQANGFNVAPVWLGDYVSRGDDVEIEDVVKRMQTVIQEKISSGELTPPFDIICHSTGGLVSRNWITAFYPEAKNCPLKRLIMLAPANFGSKLAHQGRSVLGRLAKGDWWEVGEDILHSLELASRYQWNLARRDVLSVDGDRTNPYGPGKVLPFVITGSRGFKGLTSVVNEDGSDTTVRASAANLNVEGAFIDFATDPAKPRLIPWTRRAGEVRFPYALLPERDHSTIHRPVLDISPDNVAERRLGELILQALACEDTLAAYRQIDQEWRTVTAATNELAKSPADVAKIMTDKPDEATFRAHSQLVTYVQDDQGFGVHDYVIEFYSPDVGGIADMTYFHTHVVKNVHQNRREGSRRCFYLDHHQMMNGFFTASRKTLGMSLAAVNPGKNVKYFDEEKVGARGHIQLQRSPDAGGLGVDLLRPNVTHFVEIIIPRKPIADVFRVKRMTEGAVA